MITALHSWLAADKDASARLHDLRQCSLIDQAQLATVCLGVGWLDLAQVLSDEGVVPEPLTHAGWKHDLGSSVVGLPAFEPWSVWMLWAVLHPIVQPRLGVHASPLRRAHLVEAWLRRPASQQLSQPFLMGGRDPLYLSIRHRAHATGGTVERWEFEDALQAVHPSRKSPPSTWLKAALPPPQQSAQDAAAWADWQRVRQWGSRPSAAVWLAAHKADKVGTGSSPWGPRVTHLLQEEGAWTEEVHVPLLLQVVKQENLAQLQAGWQGTERLPSEPGWMNALVENDARHQAWPVLSTWTSLAPHASQCSNNGVPVLHEAYRRHHGPAFHCLLSWGADPRSLDGRGCHLWETPPACRRPSSTTTHRELVERLQEVMGVPMVHWPWTVQPPLHQAACALDVASLNELFSAGVDTTVRRPDGHSVLDALLEHHRTYPTPREDLVETVACLLVDEGCPVRPSHLVTAVRRLWPRLLARLLGRVQPPDAWAMGSTKRWASLHPKSSESSAVANPEYHRLMACIEQWESTHPSAVVSKAWWAPWLSWPSVRNHAEKTVLSQTLPVAGAAPPRSLRL